MATVLGAKQLLLDLRQLVSRHGWLFAIAAIYLYVFPYYPRIHSANELPRVYLVQAIVDDHTFAIDRGVERWGGTADVVAHGDHQYSNKAPGSSLLAVPVYAVVRWLGGEPSLATTLWICRVVTGVIPTLVFLWLLWGYLERFTPDPDVRRLVVIAYALGSMALTYSVLYFSHQLAAVCIGSAWILASDVADRRRGIYAMAAVGALAGAAPLVDYQAAFAGVPVLVYLVARVWRWSPSEIVRTLVVGTLAAAVPIAILLGYHAVCFDSPWCTGYCACAASQQCLFKDLHGAGFLGITTLRWRAFYGSMFAADNGLVALAPWLLLAIPGGVVLWRRGDRGTVLTSSAVVVIYVLFVSSITFWRGGWGVGPRYITAMLPFMLPLVAAGVSAWRERPIWIGVAAGTVIAGVTVYTLSAATFPYWPDALHDPLCEVTFRLLADGGVAPNLGWVIGLSGLVSIAPYLAAVAALVGWAIVRVAGRRGTVVAMVVAAVIIAAFALVPHGGAEPERAYVQTVHPAVAR